MLPRTSRPVLVLGCLVAVLAIVVGFGTQPAGADAGPAHYVVDKGHSALMFKISHLGISYTYGRFNDFNGSFKFDASNPSGCAIEIDVSTESVDTNDAKRDDHLRNPDFFNCEKFPSMTFKSTKVEKVDDKTYRVTGNLTLLAETKEITIRMVKVGEGKDPWGNERMGFDGKALIKRSEFGMKHSLPHVGDEVHLTLGIEGIKQKPGDGKK